MANRDEKVGKPLSRRGLLKAAGYGAGAAGVAAVGLASRQAGAEAAAPAETDRSVAGYRETEHVKAYYALARI